ncbi:MAG: sulfite exporter TauE/SafE family protein [Bacteroidia bacterium]
MSDYFEFTLLLFAGALSAGLLGALSGLGGGVIIVPLLTLVFKVDIHYAIGASLIAVIATSTGAASAFVREGYSNIRIAMFLEIATTLGAITGAFIAKDLSPAAIAVIFGCMLIYSSFASLTEPRQISESKASKLAEKMKMNGNCPGPEGPTPYKVYNIFGGFSLMTVAGMLSGLLGIGSGAVKVLAMDKLMKVPFKVSTATSNFMIGVTAAASAGIYLHRGYIDPAISMSVMLGALAGSIIGARYMVRFRVKFLRYIFSAIIFLLAAEMIYNGITHKFG